MLVSALAAIDVTRHRAPAILIGEPSLLAPAREALAAIDGRVQVEWDWAQVAAGVAPPATSTLFVVEARGVGHDRLAAGLSWIAAAAATLDAPVVVSLDERSIDVVAALLLGPRAQLLCDPGVGDLALALALAAPTTGHAAISDTAYEGEAARLRRLNEEVARIADALTRLSRRDAAEQRRDAAVADRTMGYGAEPLRDVALDPAELRRAIRGRRLRDQFFGAGLFEEPGWDMILDLFAAELEGLRVSVSSLCIAAAVAPTTALRWVSKLTEAGLFERQPDPLDRRRAYMELSERASRSMRDYIGAMRRAGLSLA